jgi:RimJ/RimL family protein N-acetyltransferase
MLLPNGFLRPLAADDVTQAYIDGLNSSDVNRFLVEPNRQLQTRETVVSFVEQNLSASDSILFGLFVENIHRGNLRLHDIGDLSAYLGIALFDRAIWGQGWASRSIVEVAKYAFNDLGLSYVVAGIAHANTASERAFAKAGFLPAIDLGLASKFPASGDGQMWVRTKTSRACAEHRL